MVQFFSLILGVLNAAIIARWLGPQGKGIVALAMLVPGILSLVASGGINIANVYFAGSRKIDLKKLGRNSSFYGIVASGCSILLIIALMLSGLFQRIVPGVDIDLVLLALVGLPIGLWAGAVGSILHGLRMIFTINKISLLRSVLGVILVALFIVALGLGIKGAILASVLSGLFGAIVSAVYAKKAGASLLPGWDPLVFKRTVTYGIKGHIGNILQFFNYRLDMFIVNYFLSPTNVGIYSVSVALAELLWYFPNAVGFVIFPKAASTSDEEMNRFTPNVFQVTLFLTLLGAIGLALIGKLLIELIYSPVFLPAYKPMLALLPGVVLLGGAKVLANEIAGRGYPQLNSINAFIALILTVSFDLILIPKWGVLGASVASSIAYSAIFSVSIGFYLHVSKTSPKSLMYPSVRVLWNELQNAIRLRTSG